jgi:hypothetical protein
MRILWRLLVLAAIAGIVAVPSAPGSGGGATFTVTSSLDGKKVLPLRSHWLGYTDLPAAQVDHVDFLIDGTVRWVEHHAPYNYGSDDNGRNMGYLITTWLSPGLHRFVVRVTDKTGHAEKDAFTARVVAPPAPPPELAGTWTRINSVTSSHFKGWRFVLWFDRVGAWYVQVSPSGHGDGSNIPLGFVDQYDIRGHTLDVYAPVIMGVEEIENGICKGNGCEHVTHDGHVYEVDGNVCNFSGPFGRYRWSKSGDTLTITPIHEGCFGRSELLQGTWTRAH